MNTELIRKALEDATQSYKFAYASSAISKAFMDKRLTTISEALAELSKLPDEAPAPVLVVFSEAERLTAMNEYEYSLEQNTSYPVQQRLDMTAAFGAGIRHANTRAVSVDQLVESVTEVLDGMICPPLYKRTARSLQ